MKAKYIFEFEKNKDPFKSLKVGQSSEYIYEQQIELLKQISEAFTNKSENLDKLIKSFGEKYGRNPSIFTEKRVDLLFNTQKDFQLFKIRLTKFTETEEEKIRNENYNLFVFLGYVDFIETKNDNYKKVFTFENLVYIDRYDYGDLTQINFMKMRAKTYDTVSEAHIYGVNIPKNMLKDNKNYFPDDLKNNKKILKYIEENKFKI